MNSAKAKAECTKTRLSMKQLYRWIDIPGKQVHQTTYQVSIYSDVMLIVCTLDMMKKTLYLRGFLPNPKLSLIMKKNSSKRTFYKTSNQYSSKLSKSLKTGKVRETVKA